MEPRSSCTLRGPVYNLQLPRSTKCRNRQMGETTMRNLNRDLCNRDLNRIPDYYRGSIAVNSTIIWHSSSSRIPEDNRNVCCELGSDDTAIVF